MKKLLICGLAALLIHPATVTAQQRPGQPDAFAEALFDPQLVLQHAQTIALTPAQRRTILEEIKAAQTALAPLQVDMAEPALELIELLGPARVDEARALAKVEQVLRIENEVKKRQTQLLVRVKNALTQEQQTRLRELRKASQNDAASGE